MITIYQNGQKKNTVEKIDDIKAALLSLSATDGKSVEVVFDEENHILSKPLVLDGEAEPALAELAIALRAKDGEKPMITSLSPIDMSLFERVEGNTYKATLPVLENGKHPIFRTLYKGDRRVPIAYGEESVHPFGFVNHYGGYPEEEYKEYKGGLYVEYAFAEELAKSPYSARTEMMMRIEWEFIIVHVTGVDLSDTVEEEGKKYAHVKIKEDHVYSMVRRTNPCIGIKNRPLSFGNNPIYLKDNTYTYDYTTGELYIRLSEGESIEGTSLSFATLENLITLRGLKDASVSGITFTGVDSFYAVENGYHSGQANNEKRAGKLEHAAVYTASMTDFTVENCYFHDIGCNGLLMKDRSERVHILKNRFTRISMAALAVGNTTVEWEKPCNQSLSIEIEDNYFNTIGYEYPAAVAIYLTQVDGLKISHNTIENTAYSSISAGWMIPYERDSTNIKNAEISYNRIINSMSVLYDGAAIYVVGHNAMHDVEERFNFLFGNYCERDEVCHGRNGYYLDGSSSNWEVYDNVSHGDYLPLFMQFNVPSQYNWHNRAYHIYATRAIDEKNIAPDRDVLTYDCYVVPEGLATLYAKYPKAREIYENSGSRVYKAE